MKADIELLSPVGDFECLRAAVQNGADSVYFGANLFNARASATNFNYDELEKVINYCALRNVKTHLTLNILIKDNEFKEAVLLAKKAYELGISALIVQDVGLAQFLMKLLPNLPIHASTQMTIHNLECVQELEKLGYSRAVLSRELSIQEIEYICNNSNIEIETFVHGALCISYSGQCFFSSMVGGRSGNRGRCAQPCRLPYELVEERFLYLNDKKTHKADSKNTFYNGEIRENIISKKLNLKNNSSKESVIDKGYLISPRDLCSLEFLPQLINAGVKCFKIEGRLKSPEYVATVTRIYRKYIDMVLNDEKYVVDQKDVLDLKQIFNRGCFSSGHLANDANHDLVFKDKPNNMGLYIGNVANYNKLKGHVKVLLNEKLAIGDTINFEKENTIYTISELMNGSSNKPTAGIGEKVVIGRMKGNIHLGDKIYKLSSKSQLENAKKSYIDENIKLPLSCNISVKKNHPIIMEVHLENSLKNLYKKTNMEEIDNYRIVNAKRKNVEKIGKLDNKIYKNINVKIESNLVPEKALNNPISKDRIISQISKTNNTPFEFVKINIELEDNVFISSIKELNEIRRMALLKLENMIIQKNKRTSDFDESQLDYMYEKYLSSLSKKSNPQLTSCDSIIDNSNKDVSTGRTIAIYLNIINPDFDYSKLSKKYISCVYIPLRYFMRKDYANALDVITSNFKTYIYMPAIIKSNYKNVLRHGLEDFIEKYNIAGFVISSLGDFILLDKYKKKYEFIGNFTLNAFNINSVNVYKGLGLSKITLSPELNLNDINNISTSQKDLPLEIMVYGNVPIMKMNYCLLGISNKCYPTCTMRCRTSNKYYLRDRLRL